MKNNFGNNEVKLIRLCKKGDEKAQYQLYRSYSMAMYNIAIRMTGEKETAEDVIQDSFIKAFKELQQLNDEKAFGGWLKRIVINRCIDEVRKKKFMLSSFDTISEKHIEITEEVNENIDAELVHHLIKKLPVGAREILVLRALEGYRYVEIANKLNISESTAKTQFFRAKKLLGEMIKEMNYEDGYRKIPDEKSVEA